MTKVTRYKISVRPWPAFLGFLVLVCIGFIVYGAKLTADHGKYEDKCVSDIDGKHADLGHYAQVLGITTVIGYSLCIIALFLVAADKDAPMKFEAPTAIAAHIMLIPMTILFTVYLLYLFDNEKSPSAICAFHNGAVAWFIIASLPSVGIPILFITGAVMLLFYMAYGLLLVLQMMCHGLHRTLCSCLRVEKEIEVV